MDDNYGLSLAISAIIFAPGLFLLAGALFVGILLSLERTGIFKIVQRWHDKRLVLKSHHF